MNSLPKPALTMLLLACAGQLSLQGREHTSPSVSVTGGRIRGARTASGGAVFKGIPFAAPPLGNLRWREPQPVIAWKGVRDAVEYGPACIQNSLGTGAFIAPLAQLYGAAYQPPAIAMSEDCLYLNVWTPQWPAKNPSAVMVWIHGGSNVMGSGSEETYDGASLARKGVVVVTINYRLGGLGFFAHPELTREPPHEASGNYGLLDEIAALQWVRANIARFGGDPQRVTVFGESAGAINAGLLLTSPLAAGLFERAILESGPVLSLAPFPAARQQGERFGEKVALSLGVTTGPALATLRELPPERVLQAIADVKKHEADPGTILDGWALRTPPAEIFAAGKELPVDLMIGNNGREFSAFRAKPGGEARLAVPAGDSLKKNLRIFYGDSAETIAGPAALKKAFASPEALDALINDVLVACPGMAMASLYSSAGHRAYVYQFLRAVPGKGERTLGSFHGLEVPYVFGSMRQAAWNWLPFEPVDWTLSDTIETYWTNFAKTGDPNGPSLPAWGAFDSASADSMEFGISGAVTPRQGVRPAYCELDPDGLKRRLDEASSPSATGASK